MMESFTSAAFRPLVGSAFELGRGDEALEVVLAEVSVLKGADGSGSREQFSLLFHGPPSPLWPQGTYRVDHPELGRFDLFLVPLGPHGPRMRYEAAFA